MLLMNIGFILGRIFYGHYVCLLYKEFDNLEHCPNYDDAFTMYANIGKEYGVTNGDYNFRININKVF